MNITLDEKDLRRAVEMYLAKTLGTAERVKVKRLTYTPADNYGSGAQGGDTWLATFEKGEG